MSDGRAFMESLRSAKLADREAALLKAVDEYDLPAINFTPLTTTNHAHTATVLVMSDSLMIGAENSVRIPASATLCQQIADRLGLMMPTSRVFDLMWRSGTQLEPALQPADPAERHKQKLDGSPYFSPSMGDIGASLKYHDDTDAEIAVLTQPAGPLFAHGKVWLLSNAYANHPVGTAINYGYASKKAPYTSASGIKMWQTQGSAHNTAHADHSQIVRLFDPRIVVDGQQMDAHDVLKDPELAPLLSDEGVLKYLRIPGVPELARGTVIDLAEITITARPPADDGT